MEMAQNGEETAPNSAQIDQVSVLEVVNSVQIGMNLALEVVKPKNHGGARPGAGRPRGPVPEPIRDQARRFITAMFHNSRLPQDIRLQAALGLLMEPDGLIWPALDRTHAKRAAHLASLGRTVVSRPMRFRDIVRAIKALDREVEAEAAANPAGDDQVAPGVASEPQPG